MRGREDFECQRTKEIFQNDNDPKHAAKITMTSPNIRVTSIIINKGQCQKYRKSQWFLSYIRSAQRWQHLESAIKLSHINYHAFKWRQSCINIIDHLTFYCRAVSLVIIQNQNTLQIPEEFMHISISKCILYTSLKPQLDYLFHTYVPLHHFTARFNERNTKSESQTQTVYKRWMWALRFLV